MPELCDERFLPVRRAFDANFDAGLEVGASVVVTVDGKPVVDLWRGDADAAGKPWQEDTIVNVYSTTKTMAAIAVLVLVDRGDVDLDAPVATYWPGFERGGKEAVLVRHVMSHSAGLAGFDPALDRTEQLYDWDGVCERLAAQTPWWTPGDGSGYHAVTQGFLQGEIVRRVDGRSVGRFFRDEVAAPLGADFHMGLDAEHDARVGDMIADAGRLGGGVKPDSIAGRTLASVRMTGEEPKTRAWRVAELPAVGGIGNARSVARIHSALACGGTVDGVRLLSAATVERILDVQTDGTDRVLGFPVRFGMGFGLNHDGFPLSPNPRTFFWGGWGGSFALIDLDARLTVSYVMNRMEPNLLADRRGGSLVLAAYASLADS